MNCSTKSLPLRAAAAALASFAAINHVAHAGSNRTWIGPDHDVWNTSANWSAQTNFFKYPIRIMTKARLQSAAVGGRQLP